MPWLTLPYAERELAQGLGTKYGVEGIPCLVVLDAATGEVVTKEVRRLAATMPLLSGIIIAGSAIRGPRNAS